MIDMFLEEIYLKPCEGLESKQLGIIYRHGQPIVNNILAMIDVWPPDTKTLKNPLGKKNRERTLHRRPERTTPADGANHIPE